MGSTLHDDRPMSTRSAGMDHNTFRSTKIIDIGYQSIEDPPYQLPQALVKPNYSITPGFDQKLHNFNGEDILFTVYDRKLLIQSLKISKSRVLHFISDLIPRIEFDSNSESASCWISTIGGVFIEASLDGVLNTIPLPVVSSVFCVYNRDIYIGGSRGAVSVYHDGQLVRTLNKESSTLNMVLSMLSKGEQVCSLSVYDNRLFILTQTSHIYIYNLADSALVYSGVILGTSISSATIVHSEDVHFVMCTESEGSSCIIAFSYQEDLFFRKYSIRRPHIQDIAIIDSSIVVLCSDGKSPMIHRHKLSDGAFISADISPLDDYEYYMSMRSQMERPTRMEKPILKSLGVSEQGYLLIGTTSAVYLSRPLTHIESIMIKSSISFTRVLPVKTWDAYVKSFYSGSLDSTPSLQDLLDEQLFDNLSRQMIEDESIFLELEYSPLSKSNHLFKGQKTCYFWPYLIEQVVLARFSYLLTANLLRASEFHVKHSDMLTVYRRLMILVTHGVITKYPLIPDFSMSSESFLVNISDSIGVLNTLNKIAKVLNEHKEYETVVEYSQTFSTATIQYPIALFGLNKFEASVKYLTSNTDIHVKDKHIKQFVSKLYENGKHLLIIKLLTSFSEPQQNYKMASLVRSYLELRNFDEALNVIKASSESIQSDLMRSFIASSLRYSNKKDLINFEYESLTSMFYNELYSTSTETAFLYSIKLEDMTSAAQTLYTYARRLLSSGKLEDLKKALSSLILCQAIMKSSETAVRDVNSRRLVSLEKVTKITDKLRLILKSGRPEQLIHADSRQLLEAAQTLSNADLIKFVKSGIVGTNDIEKLTLKLVDEERFSSLYSLLQTDSTYSLHELALERILKEGSEPPMWLVKTMTEGCFDKLINVCMRMGNRDVIVLAVLEAKNVSGKMDLLMEAGLPKDILQEIK